MHLARLACINQGKPIKLCRDSDFPFGIDNIRFFAGASRALEGISSHEFLSTGTIIIRREPVGVVSCIIPWNYPWMISVWNIIPSLAMGNTVIAKPATASLITLLEFARLLPHLQAMKFQMPLPCQVWRRISHNDDFLKVR